jgi:CTP-dependent riboflavin kinase
MYTITRLEPFFQLSQWFSPTEAILKMSEAELVEELKKCQDQLYFYNNYTQMGREVPMTQERWDELNKARREYTRKLKKAREEQINKNKKDTND